MKVFYIVCMVLMIAMMQHTCLADEQTEIIYGDGWTHYNYLDGTQAHKFVPTNYLRWDGEWRPRIEMNMSSGDWPYLVEEFDTYYLITRLDDSLTLSKTYRIYVFQPYKIGVQLTLTPVQLNGMSTYHNVGGTDYWYITIPQTAKHLNWDNKLPTVRNNTLVNYTGEFGENYTIYGSIDQSNFGYHNVGGELRFYYNQMARDFGSVSTEIIFNFNSYIINSSAGWQNTSFDNTTEDLGDHYIKVGIFADNFDDNDYTGWSVLAGTWTASGGALHPSDNTIQHLISYNNFNMDNIRVSMDFTELNPDDAGGDQGIALIQDVNNFYKCGIKDGDIDEDDVDIRVRTGGSWTSYIFQDVDAIITSGPNDLYIVGSRNSTNYTSVEVYYPNMTLISSGGGINTVTINSVGLRLWPGGDGGSNISINNYRVRHINQLSGNVTHWHDAGTGYQTSSFIINMTTPTNTNYTVWYADNGSSFTQIGGTYTGNQTPSITGTKYQNTDLRIIMYGNTTVSPEEMEVTFVTEAVVAGAASTTLVSLAQYDELDLPLILYILMISLLYLLIVFRHGVAAVELSFIYLIFVFFLLLFQTVTMSVNYIYLTLFLLLFMISIAGITLEKRSW